MKLTALISAAMAYKVTTSGKINIEHSIDEELKGLGKELMTAAGKEFQYARTERMAIHKDIHTIM